MLVRGHERRIFAKGRYLRGRRTRQRSYAAAVVDRGGRALEGLHEADGRETVINEGNVIAGSARPVFPQFWRHGKSGDVCAAPSADIAHHATRRRGVVGGAVRICTKSLAGNSG